MATTYHQMATSPMYLLRNSVLPWIAVVLVPPSLLFAIFSGHGVLSVSITSLAFLLITPIFLAFSKQKPAPTMKKPEEEEVADEALMVEEKTDHSSSLSEEEDSDSDSDSDADWPFSSSGNNSGHSPHCSSDCSISDEESLIELALPSGHFLGLQKPAVDYLFADINEEDNMIEIDISMGSIKCSRFHEIIEA
ncbi:PREDICTED: uncharacterized protein LOC109187566 isoform X1 [Ipomoea nil]|uniref:uncharacterized protein LOC109187566 isoform X1 n=1 Tax=Ipomoea nil TaxID=35883 RepID=UPI0009011411|nr:PREDICTED: uncharacterized protein LOC109187566 isoform X1 [Ipomoea nil]